MKTLLAWTFLSLMATTTNATIPSLDQAFENYGGYGIAEAQAQTFVVGQSGRLVRVEVALSANYKPSPKVGCLTIVRQVNQVPRALPEDLLSIAQTTFPNPSFLSVPNADPSFQWVRFDLPPLNVAIGDELAIVVSAPLPKDWLWAAAFRSSYNAGMGYQGFTPDLTSQHAMGGDFLFRTYVIPVCEPATSSLALLVLGCAIAHLLFRRAPLAACQC